MHYNGQKISDSVHLVISVAQFLQIFIDTQFLCEMKLMRSRKQLTFMTYSAVVEKCKPGDWDRNQLLQQSPIDWQVFINQMSSSEQLLDFFRQSHELYSESIRDEFGL